jgi:hypothetical protein
MCHIEQSVVYSKNSRNQSKRKYPMPESDLFLQKMTNRTKITQKSSKKHSIDTISKLQFCSKEYIESTLSTIFPSLKTVLEEFW